MKNNPNVDIQRRSFLKRSSLLATGAGVGLLLPTPHGFAQSKEAIAETAFGKVRGVTSNGVHAFKGIPYGADTAGKNRFKLAVDPEPWTGIRDALEYGPATPQSDPASGRQQDGNESEDCLVMNIWSRGINDGRKRPVMFWCHGGGFRSLSASSPGYDGTNLCLRGDVVVVGINHRLNLLGFTHLAELGGEEYSQSGNVGMLDIVHALRWVKNNIEQFGGDPDRVMVFGESGGGRKVATLLGMPDAKGLFHSAVIQSGATLKVSEPANATALSERVLTELNITRSSIHKLHDLSLKQIMSAYVAVTRNNDSRSFGQSFQPVLDENVLPHHPFYPEASPVNPDVPLIVGANRTEMTAFARPEEFTLDEKGMRQRVAGLIGEENATAVIDTYRSQNPKATPVELYFLIYSDNNYVMPSITIAERRAKLSPTYLYYLTWQTTARGGRMMTPHALDIPFVFDNVKINPLTNEQDSAQALADKVSATWIQFAKDATPNAGTLPEWKKYSTEQRATMVINNDTQLINDPIAEQRKIMQPILKL